MDQSEFSVAGATGNSNAFVTIKSAVPFFSFSHPVSSRLFLLAPVSLRYKNTISTNQPERDSLQSNPTGEDVYNTQLGSGCSVV